jgi:hypothetical protein
VSGADHLRRLALQIAAQLPEDQTEAHYVLETATDLIDHLGHAPRLVRLSDAQQHQILRLVPRDELTSRLGPPGTTSPK